MSLSCWSYLLGLVCLSFGGFVLLLPSAASRALNALPRHAVSGYVLSIVAWAWAGYAVNALDIDFINPHKQYLWGAVPVCIALTWWWMGNLLPCRAVGGILTLFPYAMLYTARSHESPWRLVLVVLAYLAIVKGMVYILYPWKMRQQIAWVTARPVLFRSVGAFDALLGILLLILGATALR